MSVIIDYFYICCVLNARTETINVRGAGGIVGNSEKMMMVVKGFGNIFTARFALKNKKKFFF